MIAAPGSGFFNQASSRWLPIAWESALFSQTTGLDAAPTTDSAGVITAIASSGLNSAGEPVSAGFAGFGLVDQYGRLFDGASGFDLRIKITPTSAAPSSNIFVAAGIINTITAAAFVAKHQYQLVGINYAAANPRIVALNRYGAGALAASVTAAVAIGTTGGRVVGNFDNPLAWFTGCSSSIALDAANTGLNGATYNVVGVGFTGSTGARLLLAIGTYSGAEPGGAAAARTVKFKLDYHLSTFPEA